MRPRAAGGWTMRQIFLCAALVALTLFLGCEPSSLCNTQDFDGYHFRTPSFAEGNHSYVLTDIYLCEGDQGSNDYNLQSQQLILKTIDFFETGHRELEVTGWKLQLCNSVHGGRSSHVIGMWIDHKPREAVEKDVPAGARMSSGITGLF